VERPYQQLESKPIVLAVNKTGDEPAVLLIGLTKNYLGLNVVGRTWEISLLVFMTSGVIYHDRIQVRPHAFISGCKGGFGHKAFDTKFATVKHNPKTPQKFTALGESCYFEPCGVVDLDEELAAENFCIAWRGPIEEDEVPGKVEPKALHDKRPPRYRPDYAFSEFLFNKSAAPTFCTNDSDYKDNRYNYIRSRTNKGFSSLLTQADRYLLSTDGLHTVFEKGNGPLAGCGNDLAEVTAGQISFRYNNQDS